MLRQAPIRTRVALGLAVALGIAAASGVSSQVWGQAGREGAESRPGVYPPTDRLLSRGIRRAEESIARGEFSQAIVFLDDLLGRGEDFFTETGEAGGYSGLKEFARRLIRELPPEGRRTYESSFGPVAERQLRAALESGSIAGVAAVVERYFDTPAGHQAALVLAADHSDAGRHLAAALMYQQLLDTPAAARLYDPELTVRAAASWVAANDAKRAETLLADLAKRDGDARVEIGGREYALDAQAAPLSWLRAAVGEADDVSGEPEQQWLTYRGNAARNGETDGGLPHMRVRWRVQLIYPKLEGLFEEYSADLMRSGSYIPVANSPLAAGNYVTVRTPHGLLAVDFRTGKRIWRSEPQRDSELERLIKAGSGAESDGSNADAARAFARRIWEDYLYGMTSSDGARVYAIRDLPLPIAPDYEASPLMMFGGGEPRTLANRLSAYDLEREGALAWEIDGAAASGDLDGAFFLGAPLALGPSLYVLVEIRDDIYLAALNRETGALEWRQQLANLETGVQLDLRRRVQALMPSYEGGMLVCPTGAGLVVGVDLSKRSLAWAYQYEGAPPIDAMYRAGPADPTAGRTGTWTDGTATIAEGRVLISPRESKQLHCLDLHTGRMLWRRDRDAMKEIACIDQGLVLLADSSGLSAVKLEDGMPAWEGRNAAIPRDASPSGTGFLSGGRYFVPLTSGEVVAVNIADGKVVDRVASRDGSKLGNLICHRGAVVSQNGMFLDCFDQVDALRKLSEDRLADNANDAESLRALGEIAYNEGRLSEAIELTERAYRAQPDDLQTLETLGELLTTALDEDFAAYGSRLPLLKELERDGTVRRLDVLRIEAQGLYASGNVAGAIDACLAIYRSGAPLGETFELPGGRTTLAGGRTTLASRWVQSQLSVMGENADQELRRRIDQLVAAEAPSDDVDAGDERWERYVEFFGTLPAAVPAKLELARKLDAADRLIESQQLFLDLIGAEDATIAREATARIASQFHRRRLAGLSREFDARLAGEFGEEVCLDGATGRELVAKWKADEEAQSAPTTIDWPSGRVEVRGDFTAGGGSPGTRSRAPMWSVRLEHGDSVLASGAGFLGVRGAELSWQDGYGRPFFQGNIEPQSQAIFRQSGSVYGASRGNLVITSVGRELAALNTLAGVESQSAPLLWRAGLGSNFDYEDSYPQDFGEMTAARPGWYRTPRLTLDDKWIGVIGPMTSGGCVYQDQRGLTCVDPLTGVVKWSRSDVPAGCDLFGDDRYVFVTPMGETTAKVYSMIDGREVREVKVPPWREQVTTYGRHVVRWRQWSNGRVNLSCVDALSGKSAWRHRFDAGAKIRVEGDRFLAVVEPSGRARVIDIVRGKVVIDQQLPAQPRLEDIHFLVGADEFVLLLEHPKAGNADREVRAFSPGDSPVVDADVVAFDRSSGDLRWARPASVVRQALVLNLPPDLPFIAFAGTLMSSSAGDGGQSMSVLLLDKATGRTIYSNDALPQTGMSYCMAQVTDAARREITLDVAGRVMTVTYTDQRRSPEPPAVAEVESPGSARSGGIMGILRATIGSE
jgi:outer membrane protein assembly factor BamB